jgi:hypothetical protein
METARSGLRTSWPKALASSVALTLLAIAVSGCSTDPERSATANQGSGSSTTRATATTAAPSDACVASFARIRSNELVDGLPTVHACHKVSEWWAGAERAEVTKFLQVKSFADAALVVTKVCGAGSDAVQQSAICQEAAEEAIKLPAPTVSFAS